MSVKKNTIVRFIRRSKSPAKYSNRNQTIKSTLSLTNIFDDLEFASTKIEPTNGAYYVEVQLENTKGKSDDLFIGISSNPGHYDDDQNKFGVKFSCSAPCHSNSTIGFLVDFQTNPSNGRLIHCFYGQDTVITSEKKAHADAPDFYKLKHGAHIYISSTKSVSFKASIIQFASIPLSYRHLFHRYHVEKLKLNDAIDALQKHENEIVYKNVILFLQKLSDILHESMNWGQGGGIGLNLVNSSNFDICFVNCVEKFKKTEEMLIFMNGMHVRRIIEDEPANMYTCKTQCKPVVTLNECAEILHLLAVRIAALFEFGNQSRKLVLILIILSLYTNNINTESGQTLYVKLMTNLVTICKDNGYYQMGIKIWDVFLRLQVEDIEPRIKFFQEKLGLSIRLMTMKCNNCGEKAEKLKSCKGCMKTVYCTKKCQKYHWKYKHRLECDREWDNS